MGVNGLLQVLKPIAKQVHVRNYNGQRVAVDGYSWLHKGAYCCARELCEGIWTDKFVVYFISRIQLLRTNGLEPIVVFDGGRLPIKGDEEESRRRARSEARDKAAAHLAAGNVAMAQECYQRCVDVTPAMAKQVIEELKAHDVSFLVAPYEADAQMAYLARSGAVQLVVTEDSDLLAYGCPRVLYKLDKTGICEEVSLTDLPNCPGLPLSGWTADQFLQLCVMAGCDFLAQLPGIGIKKAHGLLRKYRSFTKVLKMLRFNGTKVPPEYEPRFQLALWAFRHARVYCTTEKALIHLAPLPGGGIGAADVDVPAAVAQLHQQQQDQKLDFLGPMLPPEVARGIAEGDLDPNTHKPYDLAAIYAGCSRPPAHLAAQLAQLRPAADPGAADQPFSSSQAAAAFSGGAAGKPRVGLSKRHAAQSGGAGRRQSGAAAAYHGGARSGGSQPAGAASGGAQKRASLGIAKYFSKPAAAAAAGAGPSSRAAAAAACHGKAAAAASPVARDAGPAVQGIKQSIARAISTLSQQLQQRQQQQQADKEQLTHALANKQQHHEEGTLMSGAGASPADEAFGLPPAKRHCSRGDLAVASDIACFADDTAQERAVRWPTPDSDPSLPINSGSLGLLAGVPSPAMGASMSLGLGSAGALASGSSADAAAGPSQPGTAPVLSSDPSFLCGSANCLGSQQPRVRGAAVSALSALFGPAAGGVGGFGRSSSPAFEEGGWGGSQPLMNAAAAGLQDAGGHLNIQSNGNVSGGCGEGYFSQPGERGSSGLLGSGSDLGGSLDGCGSSSGLSLGALGGRSVGPTVLDGTTSVSFGDTDEQDYAAAATDLGGFGTGSDAGFQHLQQCLRAGLRKPREQHGSAAADPGRSSFFNPPKQQQQQAPMSTARRHSRFRAQLLHGGPSDAADVLQSSPEDSAADLQAMPVLQDSPDRSLWDDQEHRQLLQQLQSNAQQQEDAEAAPEDTAAGAATALQRQRLKTPLLLSESSDPSSSTISNDENAEDADALDHLGITHVRQYAKLAHKAIKTVAKQQQQHVPLGPRTGLLNMQAQQRPDPAQQRQQHIAGGLEDGEVAAYTATAAAAAPTLNVMHMQLALSNGGLNSSTRGAKAPAGAGTGSFAAKLAELRYNASMFVPLDQHQQQRQQREQEEGVEEVDRALQGTAGQHRVGGMFGRGATAAAAARKPFKAPWLAAQANSPSSRDVQQLGQTAEAGSGFGAFGGFACGGGGSCGAAKRVDTKKRGAKYGLR